MHCTVHSNLDKIGYFSISDKQVQGKLFEQTFLIKISSKKWQKSMRGMFLRLQASICAKPRVLLYSARGNSRIGTTPLTTVAWQQRTCCSGFLFFKCQIFRQQKVFGTFQPFSCLQTDHILYLNFERIHFNRFRKFQVSKQKF